MSKFKLGRGKRDSRNSETFQTTSSQGFQIRPQWNPQARLNLARADPFKDCQERLVKPSALNVRNHRPSLIKRITAKPTPAAARTVPEFALSQPVALLLGALGIGTVASM